MEGTNNLKEMISNMRMNLRKALDCRSITTGRIMKNKRSVWQYKERQMKTKDIDGEQRKGSNGSYCNRDGRKSW